MVPHPRRLRGVRAVREQLSGVEVGIARLLEALDVRLDACVGREQHDPSAKHDGVRVPESAASMVGGLVEVSRSRVGSSLWPELLENAIPGQPVTWRESQQLHEISRAPVLPCGRRNRLAVDVHFEPTQKPHIERVHHVQSSPAAAEADKQPD